MKRNERLLWTVRIGATACEFQSFQPVDELKVEPKAQLPGMKIFCEHQQPLAGPKCGLCAADFAARRVELANRKLYVEGAPELLPAVDRRKGSAMVHTGRA